MRICALEWSIVTSPANNINPSFSLKSRPSHGVMWLKGISFTCMQRWELWMLCENRLWCPFCDTGCSSVLCSLFSAIDDYSDVLAEVTDVRRNAQKLGIALGLPVGGFDPTLEDVIRVWLEQNYNTERHGLPSYQRLALAVASKVGPSNPALAKKIAKNRPGELVVWTFRSQYTSRCMHIVHQHASQTPHTCTHSP